MRWLRYLLFTFALLLISILVVISWGVGTESGLHWIVAQAQRFVPGELQVNKIEGRLFGTLRAEGVTYQQDDGLNVQLEQAEWSWKPAALSSGHLHVPKLHVQGVDVQLPPSSANPSTTSTSTIQIPDIDLPVSIALDDVTVERVNLKLPGQAEPIVIDRLHLQAEADENLQITDLSVKSPLAEAQLAGSFGLLAPHITDLNLQWQAPIPESALPEGGLAKGTAQITGDVQALRLQHQLAQPVALNLDATAKDLLGALSWEVKADSPQVQWPLQGENPQVLVQSFVLQAQGDLKTYQASLNTQLSGAQIPPGTWELALNGDLQQVQISQLRGQLLDGELRISGPLRWQPELGADLLVETDKLHLASLQETWPDGINPEQLILNTRLQAQLQGDEIQLQQLKIGLDQQDLNLQAQGKVNIAEPSNPQLDLVLNWQALRWPLDTNAQPLLQVPQGALKVQGPLNAWEADLKTRVEGEQVPNSDWALLAKGSLEQAEIKVLQAHLLDGEIIAKGKAQWAPEINADFELQTKTLQLTEVWADWPETLDLNSAWALSFQNKILNIREAEVHLPQADSHVYIQGNANLQQATPSFDLRGSWEKLRWPLLVEAEQAETVLLPSGDWQVKGTSEAYEIALQTGVQGAQIPKTQVSLKGAGDSKQLQLKTLRADLLKGYLDLSGQLQWSPQVSWKLQAQGKDVNPGEQWPEWPGNLALALNTQGKIGADGKVQAEAVLDKLQGRLRDYKLEASTRATANGTTYALEGLRLQAGKARLTADVSIAERLQGEWKLNVPSLAELIPDAQGRLESQGTLAGTLNKPKLNANFEIEKLVFAALELAEADAKLNVDLQRGEAFELLLNAKQLQQDGKVLLKTAKLDAQGVLTEHQLRAELNGEKEKLLLVLKGGLIQAGQAWKGTIQTLNLNAPITGDWGGLSAPAPLQVSATQASLPRTCFQNQSTKQNAQVASLCAAANWQAQSASEFAVELVQLPLSLLNSFLPDDSRLEGGNLSGEVSGSLRGQSLLAKGNLDLSAGKLRANVDDRLRNFAYRGGSMRLNLDKSGLSGQLDLDLLEQSKIRGEISMPGLNPLNISKQQPLQASLYLDFTDMSLVPAFVEQVKEAKGAINLSANVGGTLQNPALQGQLKIDNVAVEVPMLGLSLREFNLLAKAEQRDIINIQGGLKSGEGYLNLNGDVFLTDFTDWKSVIRVQGEKLQVINTPDVRAEISPDIYITALPTQLILRGEVYVPHADITPNIIVGSTDGKAGNAVAVSQDVRIVNPINPEKASENAPPMALDIYLKIVLSEDIRLEVVGFKSRITGDLNIIQTSEGKQKNLLRGEGNLYIMDGIFRAYGQDLEIDRGQITFTGGAIDNPGLNITAVRKIHNQRSGYSGTERSVNQAGVQIAGRAQQPRVSLFSDPMVEDAQILSYILTGRAVGGSDLSSLSLGTYLTEGLYVSGGISLFDRTKTFNARYELSERWGIEAVIGDKASGADISYTVGR